MKATRRISNTLIALVLLIPVRLSAAEIHLPLGSSAASISSINFVSNIETIGVTVSGTGLPAQGELYYRQSAGTV
jgi:hypothetical protein